MLLLTLCIIAALAAAVSWFWAASRPPLIRDTEVDMDFDEYFPPPFF